MNQTKHSSKASASESATGDSLRHVGRQCGSVSSSDSRRSCGTTDQNDRDVRGVVTTSQAWVRPSAGSRCRALCWHCL